ncbi:hypothetical protein NIES267_53420 [Calothrix parasitica NIES-267]|uniref:Uncharacterized protein n=1 Tax=Calothrix parasitica NIES-267 TaxID=1973488 RepID=A0A1Z4LX56_9CYAN|nr:hypothetical protein NIES267_53420 [Calothrix parasitica NIES-267]
MSYVSVLKNIPEFLSQPAGIAAIASVGIHGAIAFILPLMPVDSESNKKESPASVGIMELSQAEQGRLPQNKSPQISALPKASLQPGLTLPRFATQPTPLPNLPAGLDSTRVILPPLPQSGTTPNVSSLPKSGSLPVLRQPNFNSSFNAKAKSGGSFRSFNPRVKLGNPTPLISRRSAPSRNSTPSRNIPGIQSAPLPPELTRVPAPPPLPPMGNPGINAGNSVAVSSQISPNAGNNVPVNQPRRISPEEFIAPTNRNIPKAGDKLTFAGQNVRQWGSQPSGSRRIELPNQPSGNVNTVPAVQNGNASPKNPTKLALARQLSEVEQRFENVEAKPPISEVIKTKPGKEGKVEGTIVVDARGKVDYFKYVDRSVGSKLDKETRNYFRKYIKENRDTIRKNGTAKVYAFALDFKSDAPKTVEFSKPEDGKLVDRLRDKDEPSQQKPENLSRSSTPIKIDARPARGSVVVPTTDSSAPVKIKQPVQIRTSKPSATSPVEVRIRNTQEVPKVPSKPKPQARVNVKEPAPQATSKPSLSSRLRNVKKDSESEDNKKTSDSKNLIQRLRKIQERRENSN